MGLQVSPGMNDEVSVLSAGRVGRGALSRVTVRDGVLQREAHLHIEAQKSSEPDDGFEAVYLAGWLTDPESEVTGFSRWRIYRSIDLH